MGGQSLEIITGIQSSLINKLVLFTKPTAYIIVGDCRNLSFFLNMLNTTVKTILRFNFFCLNHTLT
jgi:hypothetical protein